MFYRDAMRAFDAVIGEIDGAGSTQKKTGWMKQGWHRRLTWLRWLRELRGYVEGQETMALARIIEADKLKAAFTWQPITIAPRDGTRVMVYACAHRRHWFGTGYYFKGVPGDSEGWIAHSFLTAPENDSSGSFEPTHWMPMLAIPEDH